MRNYFIFDDHDSRSFDVYVSGHKTFDSPERKYNFYDVPGRNGSVTEDGKSFKNVELTYENSFIADAPFISQDFDQVFSNLKNYLLSRSGYCRLEDSYHPDEYRMAVFRKAIKPIMNDSNEFGTFDLVFECKPQRYLKYGENVQTYTSFSNASINNPTNFASLPLIRVYGNGTVGIGSYSFTVSNNANNNLYIDCDIMDCYRNASNMNGDVTFTNHEFPKLLPGINGITATSGITRIEITPRWFMI